MLTLEVLQGTNRGSVFELEQAPVTIARAPSGEVLVAPAREPTGPRGAEPRPELLQLFREDEAYLVRDLAGGGARVHRPTASGTEELALDGSGRREVALRDGDRIELPGAPATTLRVRIHEPPESPTELLAKRALADLPEVAAQVERDPATFRLLYEVSKKLGRRGLDLAAVFDGIAEAVFETVPRVTHVSIDLGDEGDRRFTTVFARARATIANDQPLGGEPLRSSRTVVRRVLRERAGIWVADARVGLAGVSDATHAM